MEDYENCSWQDTYWAMGCDIPYEDDNGDDLSEPTVDEIRIPLTTFETHPRPEPRNPYLPDISPEITPFDTLEPSFALIGV